MLNLASIVIGGFAAFLTLFALFPFLGWANWLIMPIALVGLFVGALSRRTMGRNLNLVVLGVGAVRLILGGGII